MTFADLIERKRDGGVHGRAEIETLVAAFCDGAVPDYQLSAWLMAAFLNGLDEEETVILTDAMARSGETIDLSSVAGTILDKHSTGGVADTTTLVLAPLVASCGVPVAKLSGRGLGHTGGTLDKLESIPGFRVELSQDEFVEQVRRVGVAVIAQSDAVDPADRAMYALRDVTGTVPSIPLIVASILSKKIAGGADAILLDVKFGSGAFMRTLPQARELARALTSTAARLERPVTCVLSDMNQPLGSAVGNALEVAEAIRVLSGEHPGRLTDLCVALAAKMLVLGDAAEDEAGALAMARAALASGAALNKFAEWVDAQGGDPRVVSDPDILPRSAIRSEVRAQRAGWLSAIDARQVGKAAVETGAGRESKGQAIDYGAGVELPVRIGDSVEPGDVIAVIHAASAAQAAAAHASLNGALSVSDTVVEPSPLFFEE